MCNWLKIRYKAVFFDVKKFIILSPLPENAVKKHLSVSQHKAQAEPDLSFFYFDVCKILTFSVKFEICCFQKNPLKLALCKPLWTSAVSAAKGPRETYFFRKKFYYWDSHFIHSRKSDSFAYNFVIKLIEKEKIPSNSIAYESLC